MYIKIKNNEIEKYPYYINNLKEDYPHVSFPDNIDNSNLLLKSYGLYHVILTDRPQINYKQTLVEKSPNCINGLWTQVWEVVNKSQEEIDFLNKELRLQAYRNESDPLFFKWQRGEILQQQWLDKVSEIKERYI